jgi:hypothetical protein
MTSDRPVVPLAGAGNLSGRSRHPLRMVQADEPAPISVGTLQATRETCDG